MGRDAVSVRLQWLEASRCSGLARTTAVSTIAGLTAALAPVAVGFGLVAVAGLVACGATVIG
ncbi:MAG: hypothetical protein ACRDRZ_15770, partial [Pseudonocardiaceae bacterium]